MPHKTNTINPLASIILFIWFYFISSNAIAYGIWNIEVRDERHATVGRSNIINTNDTADPAHNLMNFTLFIRQVRDQFDSQANDSDRYYIRIRETETDDFFELAIQRNNNYIMGFENAYGSFQLNRVAYGTDYFNGSLRLHHLENSFNAFAHAGHGHVQSNHLDPLIVMIAESARFHWVEDHVRRYTLDPTQTLELSQVEPMIHNYRNIIGEDQPLRVGLENREAYIWANRLLARYGPELLPSAPRAVMILLTFMTIAANR